MNKMRGQNAEIFNLKPRGILLPMNFLLIIRSAGRNRSAELDNESVRNVAELRCLEIF